MKVALLGLEFENSNMGCQALSYSFTHLFSEAARSLNVDVQYHAVLFEQLQDDICNKAGAPAEGTVINFKSRSFWKQIRKLFKESDLIVDFTGGDSFADIYGSKRLFLGCLLKIAAIRSKTPFMLGPQTYGPFRHSYNRLLAKWIIKRSRWVFSRDTDSVQLIRSLAKISPESYTDVAFSLPYTKAVLPQNGKIKVGMNISGFLWQNGYSHAKMSLSVDYPAYCETVLEHLISDERYEIYLIPHVGFPVDRGEESDFVISSRLHEKYPGTILINDYSTPMDLKNYISAMDVFIGARMHATIGAFSSGVATIPFSYSKKFEGLFGSLGYDRIIHARECSTENAITDTLAMIGDYKTLTGEVNESLKKTNDLLSQFSDKMKEIVKQCAQKQAH